MKFIDKKQLDFEIQFFEGLLKKNEQSDVLKLLAECYTYRGDLEKGLAIDRKLAQLHPDDPTVYYNFACSLALTNHLDEAFKALERAVFLGYDDLPHLKRDRDLKNLKSDPRYPRLIEKLARSFPIPKKP